MEAAGNNKEEIPVYTLGPLIHNPQVVKRLKEMGIESLDSLDIIDNGVIIIRSHGVPPDIIEKARQKGLHIIDATCPYVKNAQKYARELVDKGYQTIIFGDRDHPEVIGINGAARNESIIISSEKEIKDINLSSKVGLIAQTTKSPASFQKIVSYILPEVKELRIYNTICRTTETRQKSAVDLARQVDAMFVIGGKNSANTTRLAELCAETGTPTYHIETAGEIDFRQLKSYNKIGITAGASTPDWLIKEVIEAMSEEKRDAELQEEIQEGVNTDNTPETPNGEENPIENEEEFNYDDNNPADLKKGQQVKGKVVEIGDNGVYVDVGYKTEGLIPLRELSHRDFEDPHEIVEEGEEIDVIVLTLEDEEGNMVLSKKRADFEKAWERILKAYENDEIIEAEVTREVKGGLVVDIGLRGFVHASHVAIGYVEDLSDYVGKTLRLKVIEVERDKNNVVLSAKKVLEEEREKQKEKTLEELQEGQVVKGKVTKIVDFGAFVDLGGIEGLLHISEMSWGRIEHPSEVLEEGQEIEVKVLAVNKEEERISLGLKQLLPDPWEEFAKKHYEGEVVSGTITKIVDFGAFMEIENGIEGLIHISQLSHRHVKTPDEVVSVGEEIKAEIINIDPEQKRVGLSIKALEEQPETPKKVEAPKKEPTRENESTSGVTIGEIVGDILKKEDDK
ncbi:4-hydroxy-3-methylbut-2-enyl diphosphate reductase [Halothermothrix orenii H 168]|uniref:4-hydroxy-3-methylbut-2-enyl diphosphate reductase n=2 Tax=Halothermothrix orenii TaxID=31909 RepID=B8CWY2_HALOH|nr:4-hydroxy-3-methylbut-2-enyl diphosphate reductase [Halothermothrix orenii H 168]